MSIKLPGVIPWNENGKSAGLPSHFYNFFVCFSYDFWSLFCFVLCTGNPSSCHLTASSLWTEDRAVQWCSYYFCCSRCTFGNGGCTAGCVILGQTSGICDAEGGCHCSERSIRYPLRGAGKMTIVGFVAKIAGPSIHALTGLFESPTPRKETFDSWRTL